MSWPSASFETGTIDTASPGLVARDYVGRFAPSPTGPLHFGSLIAAVASYLDARSRNGRWLLRIEDIDPPREQPGATGRILLALERYGFEWDGTVRLQHESRDAHEECIEMLLRRGLAYPCGCSRRDLDGEAQGTLGTIYPGTCRSGTSAAETAIRVFTRQEPVVFLDALQGRQSHNIEATSGDFIIRRKDRLIAYQLAVVVDDFLQGVTDIVRGIDLMDSTPRQIWLQQLLGYPLPRYAHIPVATNRNQQKLSKTQGAREISLDRVAETLLAALAVLGQDPPGTLATATLDEIWQWSRDHWNLQALQGQKAVPVEHLALAQVTEFRPGGQ